mgnify:CR=1 FL=1
MVKLKNDNLKLHDSLIINEDMNDPCRYSKKLLEIINDPNPTDADDFFNALEEDDKEFIKRVWGNDNGN